MSNKKCMNCCIVERFIYYPCGWSIYKTKTFCENCNKEIDKQDKYCRHCGSKFVSTRIEYDITPKELAQKLFEQRLTQKEKFDSGKS